MNRKYLIIVFAIVIIVGGILFKKNDGNDPASRHDAFRDDSHLILTKHVKCRMDCRHITEDEIKQVIHTGNVNQAKSGPGTKGDETYALEGYSNERQHIRVIVAPESDGLVVITCIDLDNEWPCNCY